MRWYRFGNHDDWLKAKDKSPLKQDPWAAFIASDWPSPRFCYVYENSTLLAVIDCHTWMKDEYPPNSDYLMLLSQYLQTELDKIMSTK